MRSETKSDQNAPEKRMQKQICEWLLMFGFQIVVVKESEKRNRREYTYRLEIHER